MRDRDCRQGGRFEKFRFRRQPLAATWRDPGVHRERPFLGGELPLSCDRLKSECERSDLPYSIGFSAHEANDRSLFLPNQKLGRRHKGVIRDIKVPWCRALAYARRSIVGRTVAGTKITAILPLVFARPCTQGNASKMGADAHRNQPFRPASLGSLSEGLRVTQDRKWNRIGFRNFFCRKMAHEQRLRPVGDNQCRTHRNCGDVYLRCRYCQNVSGGIHRVN